ncbi:hypothetical protein PQQ51_02895 [Paraburkholderia xenovorans]|uniref:hypothetical protein n=1 Tax=Paraburkholderia xenovorans TaxID=36873 RepID=UPI0038BD36D0
MDAEAAASFLTLPAVAASSLVITDSRRRRFGNMELAARAAVCCTLLHIGRKARRLETPVRAKRFHPRIKFAVSYLVGLIQGALCGAWLNHKRKSFVTPYKQIWIQNEFRVLHICCSAQKEQVKRG